MRKFKNTFKSYDVFSDEIILDIIENVNSITVFNNGPKNTGIVVNTNNAGGPVVLTGQTFTISGNELELYYDNKLKIIPYFGLPTITVIFKTFYD